MLLGIRSVTTRIANGAHEWRTRILKAGLRSGYWMFHSAGESDHQLFQSVTPRPGERLLVVGANALRTGAALAARFPEVSVIVFQGGSLDPLPRRYSTKYRRPNLEVKREAVDLEEQPDASFNWIIALYPLHYLSPQKKCARLTEFRRLTRHGGTLHLTDYDQPTASRESAVLRAASYMFGEESVRPHLDGSWIKLIEKAKYRDVRRESSRAVAIGRVTVVSAKR